MSSARARRDGMAAMQFQGMIWLLILLSGSFSGHASAEGSSYIVYLGHHKNRDKDLLINRHLELLSLVKGRMEIEEASEYILYHYKHAFSGFAAMLTIDEANQLSRMEDVVSVFPSGEFELHTTQSWEFLGLVDPNNNLNYSSPLWDLAKQGQDVIIGMIDSGIWPESKSFNDDGMEELPPNSWRGECEEGTHFNKSHCNKKIIGARSFLKGFETKYGPVQTNDMNLRSARDTEGHGTHTAAIAAGRIVPNVSGYGGDIAQGTAMGGFPLARLAIYKASWWSYNEQRGAPSNTMMDEDLLAATDMAVADGVHVISVSMGRGVIRELYEDAMSIGGLHAMQAGILVSTSAGNKGPARRSVDNIAPWIITAAASSIDRLFLARLSLGNGDMIYGDSLTPFNNIEMKSYRLVRGQNVLRGDLTPNERKEAFERECGVNDTLDPSKVEGSIVFCESHSHLDDSNPYYQSLHVKRAGGVAMIFGTTNVNPKLNAIKSYEVPTLTMTKDKSTHIQNYMANNELTSNAMFWPLVTVQPYKPAPYVAMFSSQGPNGLLSSVLKPDISAPGLSILSAWSGAIGPSLVQDDRRRSQYNILSGTSMSCPHVTAIAALIKSIHPSWSSSAIKSAIMTTASHLDNIGQPLKAYDENQLGDGRYVAVLANPFSVGAGQIDPKRAIDPGLIYDATPDDYDAFLCNIGYNEAIVRKMSNSNVTKCPETLRKPNDLNQPYVVEDVSEAQTASVVRKMTNVGAHNSTYYAVITSPEAAGMELKVEPRILQFTEIGQTLSFLVHVSRTEPSEAHKVFRFASLTWVEYRGGHRVRIPIIVKTRYPHTKILN